jgi:hypothetical protein
MTVWDCVTLCSLRPCHKQAYQILRGFKDCTSFCWLLDYRTVWLSDRLTIGPSDYRTVGFTDRLTIGPSDLRHITILADSQISSVKSVMARQSFMSDESLCSTCIYTISVVLEVKKELLQSSLCLSMFTVAVEIIVQLNCTREVRKTV